MKSANKLLRWYDKNGRDLPWRKTRNPYRILVSEVMLQQTQVDRVKGYYCSWLKQFPNWKTLAATSNADVLRAWAGLGYNRRALVLRDIAGHVVGQGIPKTYEAWLAIKGIGPYTAAAIMTFTGKETRLPIDTNVRRFIGRFLLGKAYPQPKDDDRIRRKGEAFIAEASQGHDVPQAIFDLATMHCTKVPDCLSCPMQNDCKAAAKFLSGSVSVPKQMIKSSSETKHRNKKHPDRIYRGRILKQVRESTEPIAIATIADKVDPMFNKQHDQEWLEAMITRLERDEMVRRTGDLVELA